MSFIAGVWLAASAATGSSLPESRTSTAGAPFIGTWYGEGQPTDPNVFWIARYEPGGGFVAQFRVCHGKNVEDQYDTGVWTYANNVDDIVTLTVNGMSMYHDDRYDTVSIDAHKYIYRHEGTGFVFTAVKVDAKSGLPSCASIS